MCCATQRVTKFSLWGIDDYQLKKQLPHRFFKKVNGIQYFIQRFFSKKHTLLYECMEISGETHLISIWTYVHMYYVCYQSVVSKIITNYRYSKLSSYQRLGAHTLRKLNLTYPINIRKRSKLSWIVRFIYTLKENLNLLFLCNCSILFCGTFFTHV